MIKMTAWRDAGERAVYEFDQQEIMIGRMAPADVLLDSDAVSRRHSRLTRKGSGWQVADLGAANGLFIQRGGTPPPVRVIVEDLHSGDVLCIERYRILFEQLETRLAHKGGLVEGAAPEFDGTEGPTDVRRLTKEERDAMAEAARTAMPAKLEGVAALSSGMPVSQLTRDLPAGATSRSRHLEVFAEGTAAPRKIALGLAPVQFGSDPTCDVRLTGMTVPRFVAVVEVIEDRVMVRRLSTVLGPKIMFNGQAVREAELTDGAKFFVGNFTAVVRLPRR